VDENPGYGDKGCCYYASQQPAVMHSTTMIVSTFITCFPISNSISQYMFRFTRVQYLLKSQNRWLYPDRNIYLIRQPLFVVTHPEKGRLAYPTPESVPRSIINVT
jgi:hypothetical protein